MKKIYLNLLVILGTLSLLVGSAYAYFSSNSVTMTGITLATAGPALRISLDGAAGLQTVTGTSYSNIYPGWTSAESPFYLKNQSGNGAPIAKIIPTITSQSGDWDTLKSVIQACFKETAGGNGCTGSSNDWLTLDSWSSNSSTNILLTTITDGTQREISLLYRMDPNATDDANNKTVSGLTWTFVGRTN